MLTAIVGINWGDEGKGRMVDLLSQDYDIVVRYQGGNNAGHTVVNERGKFILNLLPSGILRPEVTCVMGNGMVIDLTHLHKEIASLREKGVVITPDNLKISDRAIICMPYHVRQDCLEEDRLGDAKYGSTRRGIAPVYGDKYLKKSFAWATCVSRRLSISTSTALSNGKPFHRKGLRQHPYRRGRPEKHLKELADEFLPYVTDTGVFLNESNKAGKRIMFEAQLGALRDIDFGINPYTSSSNTIAAYAPIGAGVPNLKLDNVIGIMKAYSSCVGEGPFTVEAFGKFANDLREAGGEYGAATGRPRRVGAFDVVASRYGIRMQGADEIALTKLDVLSYLDAIPVCTAYEVGDKITTEFPFGEDLNIAKPEFTVLKGWKRDISKCRKPEDLPKEAVDYIRFIEKATECKIKYVSVGAEREDYIVMY